MAFETRKRRPFNTSKAASPTQTLATMQQLRVETGVPVATWRRAVANGDLPCIVFPKSRRQWIDRADAQRLMTNSKSARRGRE